MSNDNDLFMTYVKQMAFLGTIALIILWVAIILVSFAASFGNAPKENMTAEAIEARLQPVEKVAVKEMPKAASAEVSAAPAVIDGDAIVKATCAACHATGVLESPKIGDAAAWEARLQANGGMDGLIKSAIAGKGAMPPKGGNAALSEAEMKAAIEAMLPAGMVESAPAQESATEQAVEQVQETVSEAASAVTETMSAAATSMTEAVSGAVTSMTGGNSGIDGAAIYNSTCFACHGTGLLESPKLGDKAAWDARLQANGGLAGLVNSAIAGKGAMPPKGGNTALSDAEIQAAVEFMIK
jgi:cytochrome c5